MDNEPWPPNPQSNDRCPFYLTFLKAYDKKSKLFIGTTPT